MGFQKSQPAGAATLVPASASMGQLKKSMHHPPHEKRTFTKCMKKLAAFRTLADCHGPYETLQNPESYNIHRSKTSQSISN